VVAVDPVAVVADLVAVAVAVGPVVVAATKKP
jgi:hypothetical protein